MQKIIVLHSQADFEAVSRGASVETQVLLHTCHELHSWTPVPPMPWPALGRLPSCSSSVFGADVGVCPAFQLKESVFTPRLTPSVPCCVISRPVGIGRPHWLPALGHVHRARLGQ